MTAQVLTDFFTHEHNRLAVAEQEYELARQEYRDANRAYDPFDRRSTERFHQARERRSLAWDHYWAVKRGY